MRCITFRICHMSLTHVLFVSFSLSYFCSFVFVKLYFSPSCGNTDTVHSETLCPRDLDIERERGSGTPRRLVSAASRSFEINCSHTAPLLVYAADLTRQARRHDDFCDTSITALVLSSSRRCPMPLPFHPLRPTAMSISLDIFLCSVAVRGFGVHRMSLRFASLFRSSLVFASSHLVQGRLLG